MLGKSTQRDFLLWEGVYSPQNTVVERKKMFTVGGCVYSPRY